MVINREIETILIVNIYRTMFFVDYFINVSLNIFRLYITLGYNNMAAKMKKKMF